jgi:hypothetical protein
MTHVAQFVPSAIAKFYRELTESSVHYPDEERACWHRLVSDERMRRVYGALSLSELGWRIFFDAACIQSRINPDDVRERRRRTYELLEQVRVSGERLAQALERLEGASVEFDEPRSYKFNLDPLLSSLDLLGEAAHQAGKGGYYEMHVVPVLEQLGDLDCIRGIPTPAELVRAVAAHAEEACHLRRFDGGELAPGNVVLRAAIAGRQSNPLRSFLAMLGELIRLQPEIAAVDSLPDADLAALASVVLDRDDIGAGDVSKVRLRPVKDNSR